MSTKHTTKREHYIANCLHRIFNAEADLSKHRDREQDVAHAFQIAAKDGIDDAHEYLIKLVGRAESGKYKEKPNQ